MDLMWTANIACDTIFQIQIHVKKCLQNPFLPQRKNAVKQH